MAVLDPIKLTITNYPEGQTELLPSENNPEDPSSGHHDMPFSRELFIEREDFMMDPPKKYFRLAPGATVRLKSAYIITCEKAIINESTGEVEEIICTYHPDSKSGSDTSGIKAKGTLHWVNAPTAVKGEVRMYDRLFMVENPLEEGVEFLSKVNPNSLTVLNKVVLEPALAEAKEGDNFQFLRQGYFTLDRDSKPDHLVFNQTVSLKEGWTNKE
jgi:glutaminyl-tRNA synthetase